MRLSQLARKVSKTPKELLDFLQSNGIGKYSGSNVKVDVEHINFVIQYFTQEYDEAIVSIPASSDNIKNENSGNPSKSESEETNTPVKINESVTKEETKNVELIRAPKVKLQGVKVVGKIDLPDRPVKTERSVINDPGKEQSVEDPNYKRTNKKSNKLPKSRFERGINHRKSKKRLTYQEKLRQEEREKERRKKKQMQQDRERKRKHYQKNVQSKIKPLPAKKKTKSLPAAPETTNITKTQVPLYKNPLRRFWAWLNGAYDEY